MQKNQKKFFRVLLALFFSSVIVSQITAQNEKWVTYHGDFASFKVRDDLNLDFENKGGNFIYYISDSKAPNKKLVISSGHKQPKYKLADKKGYTQKASTSFKNAQGVERNGTTPSENQWREIFIFYGTKSSAGLHSELIHVYYDDISGDISPTFDEIIDSIELKNVYKQKLPFEN